MGTDQSVNSTSMLATYFHEKQNSTKVALLHRPIFRENSTNEIWKGEGRCWKSDYNLDRVVDHPVEALDEFCFLSKRKIHLCISPR